MMGIVLLTGATGFVGRQVLRALSEHGVHVRVIIREGKKGKLENLDCIESVIETPDLFAENAVWWAEVCRGIDAVLHVAWYAEPGKYLQSEKNIDCLTGTLQMAKGAALARVRRFIGIGTCFEYDLTGGQLSIQTPLKPLSPYAGAKVAAFTMLSQWLPAQGVEFAWCRLFYLHGEGEDERRLVPYIRSKLSHGEFAELTTGNQVRDYLDVHDAGLFIVDVALSGVLGAVNICSGVPVTVRKFAEQLADEYGRRDLLKFGARQDDKSDPSCVVGIKTEEL